MTLLGPSGSGKTTTLMMLAGFERPTAGSIVLDGRDITNVPAHRRGLGVVFQSYALFPHMSVFDNVAFPLAVRGIDKSGIHTRVGRVIDLVKLGGLQDRLPRQLSGGQQQRVALARALVFDPPIILMDEPLGALDRQLREHMQIEISRLHRELGVTVVYVTHDQDEALTMSDRIAVFEGGRVLQLAAPQEIYGRPADEFVATFVGENNRIVGTVEGTAADLCTVRLADGALVRATPSSRLSLGTPVFLSLRPERVHCGPAEEGWNSLEGRITQVIFRGDHVRVCASTAAASEIHAKVPDGALKPSMSAGDIVSLSWAPGDCLALPRALNAAANSQPREERRTNA